MKKLLLNGEEKHLSATELPLLIHAGDGTGGSMFSISLMADLYNQGTKLVFLCGFHMARDEFIAQTGTTESIFVQTSADIQHTTNKRVIFVGKETPELFMQLVSSLPDIAERVIFFKNFDLFDGSLFESIAATNNIVLMGDVDKCAFKEEILSKTWKTKIYFSPSAAPMEFELPDLPKYAGYLHAQNAAGVVSLA